MSTPLFNGTWRFEQNAPDQLGPAIEKLARRCNLAIEGLTEEQLAEAIKQAILCGDFQRHVITGTTAQSVVYLPYATERGLRGRVAALEATLDDRCPGWRDA